MCISFKVRVPVLSEHRMAMPAMSSMAARRVTMAPCLVNSLEPRARVVVVTISMAMGMAATISTTTKARASINGTIVHTYIMTTKHMTRDKIVKFLTMKISKYCTLDNSC